MRSMLRNATALATSLALLTPTAPAFAQTDRSLARDEARAACRAEGLRGRDQIRPCVQERLREQGFEIADDDVEVEVEGDAEAVIVQAEEEVETATEQVIEEIATEGEDTIAEVAEEVVEVAPEPEAEVAETPAPAPAPEAAPATGTGDAVALQEGDGADALRDAVEAEAQADAAVEPEGETETETAATTGAEPTRREIRQATRQACRADGLRGDDLRACVAEELGLDASEAQPESTLAEEIAAEPEPELTREERRAARQAERALRRLEEAGEEAAAAAAAAADDASGEVVEEVVSAEDVRTSDEDFETSAIARERDSGLSSGEKFALGALGLLAVGTVLNNRDRVVSNSGDRVVVQRADGDLQVLKDDDALLRSEGDRVRTQTFEDGSTRTIVIREDGSQVITVRDASLRVLRRTLVRADGTEVTLIDDTRDVEPVEVATLPPAPVVSSRTGDALGDALRAELGQSGVDRGFSLSQVRRIAEVRQLAPAFEVNAVTFDSGSAAIRPEQAANLADLGRELTAAIRENPAEVFLIEGHTDAVGDAAYNLALSDRRAESLALALNEYFGVPVENMVVQGYGEEFLKVPTLGDERANRRATVRQITDLLRVAAAN